ncbi:TonB-dependent receptor [Solimicrobium silvestre]|uniref:TonB-dependent Receptor Plug Domain n=1 Tax=Solimicrobium silvestre TaxID=2099400 RepID=A0A2S9GTX3_9BURK|nr:TonB-dependent receptor [Solimicrobium silvestre]PRC91158.1 TonB-dependent Receptor Plug Domain [Solimicrobium silvestre]
MRHHSGRSVSIIAASLSLAFSTAGAQQTPAMPAMAVTAATAPEPVVTEVPSADQHATKDTGQIKTVVITAQKRTEDASKVPLSISVISGDDLVAQHIVDFADITRSIPNVSFSGGGGSGNAGNGPGLSSIEMRGISSTSGSATVGVYLDDVSMTVGNIYSMGQAEPKFFDLDRVEVLRGPQGTLYGSSSMGGTVKFLSNQPNLKEQEATIYSEVSSTKGGGTNYTANGVFNAVLTPNELAFRIGVEDIHKSGFINQVSQTTGALVAPNINWEADQVVRMAMKWAPTKDLTITPSVFYQQVQSGDIDVSYTQTQNGTPLPMNQTSKLVREPGVDRLLVPSLTVNYGTDYGDLTFVSSYFQRKFNRTQDATAVDSVLLGSLISIPSLAAKVSVLPAAVWFNNDIRQSSEELRFASKPYDPSVSPITWVAGVYIADMHTNITDNEPIFGVNAAFAAAGASTTDPTVLANPVSAGFPNDNSYFGQLHYHDTQQAIFGEANYYFMPNLHATFGLRYLEAKEEFEREGGLYFNNDGTNDGNSHTFANTSGSKATPKIALTWEVDHTDTLYALAGEGFRLGGANLQIPQTLCGLSTPNPASYASDTLWSYEVGDKSRFLDNHLSVNSSLFYVDWKNMQQQIFLGCGYDYNTNVGSATSYGAEVEVKARPISSLLIDFSAGITHATLSDNGGENAGVPGAVAGALIPGVPKFNAALTGQYNFNISDDNFGFARAGVHWTGTSNGGFPTLTNGSIDPDYRRPAYATADFSTGISWEKWELSFFVKNLANNEKIIQHPIVQTNTSEAYRIDPRIIGISVSGKL